LYSFFRRAKLLVQNAQFLLWKRKHPSAPFKDYFLEIVRSDFARGLPHPTLGDNLSSGAFGISGRKTFPSLVRKYCIAPDDTCVDYGCGTLRVGVHAIRYLNPGCYWGMDISARFLAQGLELIGSELARMKSPNLRVISPATIGEAAAAKPKFLFSVNVLLHVHPGELSEFMANILSIIRGKGLAVVTGEWSEVRTIQKARQSWIHSEADLREAVQTAGGHTVFVSRATHGDRTRGLIEIRRDSGAARRV
jgi:SAM-dependent methyltransferase